MLVNTFYNIIKTPFFFKNIRGFSSKPQHQHDFLYGVNSVEAAMYSNKRQLHTLYLSDSEHIQLSSRATKLVMLAKKMELPVIFTHKDKLSRLVLNQPHQNIVLKCESLKIESWQTQKQFNKGVFIFCDKITDPQNFGAILRSCLFFGVKTVFTGKKNHCPLNSTVSKTSAGAIDLIDIMMVDNGTQFLKVWRQNGGTVLATSVDETKPHITAHQMKSVLAKDNINKILLILGSQGKGVSPHLISGSDYTVAISRIGSNEHPYNVVDSLNVSAALSTLLFELTRQN